MSKLPRRAFLRHAAALSSLGAAAPLGLSLSALGHASAQAAQDDYKALVCVFLYGGNDAFNTVLATDESSWGHYVAQRDLSARGDGGGTSIALLPPGTPRNLAAALATPARLGGVLPIGHSQRAAHASRTFALHPLLGDVRGLYEGGRVAVLANVGPLRRPLTKAQYNASPALRPSKLFSHNDQQSTWQSFYPEGASEGWGGRMGDLLMSGNGTGMGSASTLVQRSFTCIAPGSSGNFLAGQTVQPLQVGVTGILGLGQGNAVLGSSALRSAMADLMTTSTADTTSVLASEHQQIVQRGLAAEGLLGRVLPPISSTGGATPWATPGQHNPWADPLLYYSSPVTEQTRFNNLALQLQMVARLIDANRLGGFGVRRQVFMVSIGGFDTHDHHNTEHNDRMAQVNHALAYFDRVLGQMPSGDMRSQVTTFTASEFGRSLTNNGDGTDHGWGAHHLIMGGAVRGGEVYGTCPQLATADSAGRFDSPDLIHNGVMLPSTSVDQYAYTLGRWLGVSDSDLRTILPNLATFNASAHDLGFMG